MIYVPAFPLLFTKMDSKVGHVRRYTKNELARKVSAAGFTIRKLHYVDSLGFIITLLYRCMGRTDGGISRVSLIIYDRIIFPVSRMVDCVMRPLFGKNLYVTATKKDVSVPTH